MLCSFLLQVKKSGGTVPERPEFCRLRCCRLGNMQSRRWCHLVTFLGVLNVSPLMLRVLTWRLLKTGFTSAMVRSRSAGVIFTIGLAVGVGFSGLPWLSLAVSLDQFFNCIFIHMII